MRHPDRRYKGAEWAAVALTAVNILVLVLLLTGHADRWFVAAVLALTAVTGALWLTLERTRRG